MQSTIWEGTIIWKKERNFVTDCFETMFTYYILDDTLGIFGKRPQYIFKFKIDNWINGIYFTSNKEFIELDVGDRIALKRGDFFPRKQV